MEQPLSYTDRARRFSFRYPWLNSILTQINFWVLAYLFLAAIIFLSSKALGEIYDIHEDLSFLPFALWSVAAGVVFGATLGAFDKFINSPFLRSRPMGMVVILQGFLYYFILLSIVVFTRFVIWEALLFRYFFWGNVPDINETAWRYYYLIVLLFTFISTFIISFITQMNKKFGPGILLPLLIGRYRNPKEEYRVFMFMDLRASTTHAEGLGHLRYSKLIRDCFLEINEVTTRFQAEVYQYVGDEIVLSWPLGESSIPVDFFFAVQERFRLRQAYYNNAYGFVPEFKAGLHSGPVTVVEIGEVKRDLAYHGDTLNTTARIQSVCNEFGQQLLISRKFHEEIKTQRNFVSESLGSVLLRGKSTAVEILGITPVLKTR